nr:DNA-binding pseudobarrel domain-containing protein [Tanacetum cinerariifolium]
MADYSQKRHDRTSSRSVSSNSNTDGLAAIIRPHLDKECPLNEEVKQLEEVKYGEFGRSAPFNGNNEAKFRVGAPGYYTCTNNRPPYEEKRPSIEELMNKHQEESTRRSAEMKEWFMKLQENTKINTRNQSASLKNLETQIEQLTKELNSRTTNVAPTSSNAKWLIMIMRHNIDLSHLESLMIKRNGRSRTYNANCHLRS